MILLWKPLKMCYFPLSWKVKIHKINQAYFYSKYCNPTETHSKYFFMSNLTKIIVSSMILQKRQIFILTSNQRNMLFIETIKKRIAYGSQIISNLTLIYLPTINPSDRKQLLIPIPTFIILEIQNQGASVSW